MLGAEESRTRWRLEIWAQDVPAQVGTVELEGAEADEQKQEPAVITLAETIVDPRTVVVEFGNAGVAQRAVLAAGWLGYVASTACLDWSVEDVIVRVLVWMLGLRPEVVARVGSAEIGEDVRQCNQYWAGE